MWMSSLRRTVVCVVIVLRRNTLVCGVVSGKSTVVCGGVVSWKRTMVCVEEKTVFPQQRTLVFGGVVS